MIIVNINSFLFIYLLIYSILVIRVQFGLTQIGHYFGLARIGHYFGLTRIEHFYFLKSITNISVSLTSSDFSILTT